MTSFHIWTLTLKNVKPEANLDFFVFLFSLQEESIEEVIKDTESLFKSREKEYQETIDQIEVRRSGAVGRVKLGKKNSELEATLMPIIVPAAGTCHTSPACVSPSLSKS